MKLSHYIENQTCVVSITGNIVSDALGKFVSYLNPLLEQERLTRFILDLKRVNIIDSMGNGELVSIYRALQKRNATMALCGMSQINREAFSLSRLDKILNIYPTVDDAIQIAQ